MNYTDLEIIIPIYNEGDKILKLMDLFHNNVKTNFKVLLCYDSFEDNVFEHSYVLKKYPFEIFLIKNPKNGPLQAIKAGFESGNSNAVIVYPADDFLNYQLIDKMYSKFTHGNDIVVASRFMKGGSMDNCPFIKSILVRTASFTLYFLSSIPVRDASNGFRLFSRKLLKQIKIESKVGFAYSLELLVKCHRLKKNIVEIPARWEERSEGESRFKVFKWLPQYLKWYIYGLSTTWLKRKKI
jgi:glycosyltransferase involved in cell wall biosynthesis